MPVRNYRRFPEAIRRKRRLWFVACLWAVLGANPLVGQDNALRPGEVDFSRYNSSSEAGEANRTHQSNRSSGSGDIPASPWGHRNNPTRPGMIKQPSAPNRQPAFGTSKPTPARFASSGSELRNAPLEERPIERPATVRWGALRPSSANDASSTPVRESEDSVSLERPSARTHEARVVSNASEYATPSLPSEPTFDWSEELEFSSRGLGAEQRPVVLDGENDTEPALKQAARPKERTSRAMAAAQTVSNRKAPANVPPNDAPQDSPTLKRTFDGSDVVKETAPVSVPQSAKNAAPTSISTDNTDAEVPRLKLAQRISHELLSQSPAQTVRAPQILERPAGWDSIRNETKLHLEQCDSLLRRGAVHSARAEVISGLRRLYRTMDLYRGAFVSEPALESALLAFKEEADFHALRGGSVSSVASTHATPALQSRPLEHVSPEVASQHYRAYARYELIKASEGHPWASPLLYALGKTFEREADLDADNAIRLRSQAVVCYQAAVQIQPSQSEASNQLGYALMHLDRIDEAYEALRHSIQARPNSQAWSNLAEVYRRRGSTEDAQYAIQQAVSLHREPEYSAENPQVTELDPAVFARYSPMPNIQPSPPVATMPAGTQLYTQASPAAATMPQTATKSSFFSKIFR